MAIQVASPTDGLDLDEDIFEEEESTYNFRELLDEVIRLEDCIITVATEDVDSLKKGLITRKSKDNVKLKNSGLLADDRVLAFLHYPAMKDGKEIPGQTDVRVKLRAKKGVKIISIAKPDDL